MRRNYLEAMAAVKFLEGQFMEATEATKKAASRSRELSACLEEAREHAASLQLQDSAEAEAKQAALNSANDTIIKQKADLLKSRQEELRLKLELAKAVRQTQDAKRPRSPEGTPPAPAPAPVRQASKTHHHWLCGYVGPDHFRKVFDFVTREDGYKSWKCIPCGVFADDSHCSTSRHKNRLWNMLEELQLYPEDPESGLPPTAKPSRPSSASSSKAASKGDDAIITSSRGASSDSNHGNHSRPTGGTRIKLTAKDNSGRKRSDRLMDSATSH